MPIYEFACDDCDETFEKLIRSLSSSDPVVCPTCGSEHTRKKMSTFASKSGGSSSSFSSSSSSSCSTGST